MHVTRNAAVKDRPLLGAGFLRSKMRMTAMIAAEPKRMIYGHQSILSTPVMITHAATYAARIPPTTIPLTLEISVILFTSKRSIRQQKKVYPKQYLLDGLLNPDRMNAKKGMQCITVRIPHMILRCFAFLSLSIKRRIIAGRIRAAKLTIIHLV